MPDQQCWECAIDDTQHQDGPSTMDYDQTHNLNCIFRWRHSWGWNNAFTTNPPKANLVVHIYTWFENGSGFQYPLDDFEFINTDFTYEQNTLTEYACHVYNLDDDPNQSGHQTAQHPTGAMTFHVKAVITLKIVDTQLRDEPCDALLPPSQQEVINDSWPISSPPFS